MNDLIAKCIRSFLPIVLCLITALAQAQKLTPSDKKELRKKEDSLKIYSAQIVFNEDPAVRFRSDSNFTRTFVRALKIPRSFYYGFDSLNISKLYSPDSAFRIFTWQVKKDEYVYLQKGAIQMNTPDGSLKLFPLFDYSMFTARALDSVRGRNNWIGAIYYRIIQKEYQGKKFYTLIGFDDFSVNANKKWVEVMHFDDNGEPRFGGPFFSFKEDSVSKPIQARFSIEYKKEARTQFNYDPEKDLIIFDNLVSESGEPDKSFTMVPSGDFEGFKWKNGQWVHIEKLKMGFMLGDGAFPQEATIRDDAGNINEKQLGDASRRNLEKAKSVTTPGKKPATPAKKPGSGNE